MIIDWNQDQTSANTFIAVSTQNIDPLSVGVPTSGGTFVSTPGMNLDSIGAGIVSAGFNSSAIPPDTNRGRN
jgi:hypothetical protein